jgi:cell division protein ZapB
LAGYIKNEGKDNMLDIEAIIQQFELIEQKVEHVVQARKQLQKENEDLNNRIGQLENADTGKNRGRKENTRN